MFPAGSSRRSWLLTVSCLIAAGCGAGAIGCSIEPAGDAPAAARPPAPPPAPDPDGPPARPKIVALGDSLTAGLGLVESQSYPALLQKKLDAEGYEFEVVNAGVSGDTSAGGLRRLDWALEGDVRVLVVALGANDGLRGLSVEQMKENLSAIIQRARARGITVILAGMEAPPNYGPEYTRAFRQAYRDVAQKERVLFIPFLLDNVAGQSHLNQSDAIHPNPQGTAIVAETVWSVLRPMLDQMPAGS
jgi:acyl-CoA thioesterase-1